MDELNSKIMYFTDATISSEEGIFLDDRGFEINSCSDKNQLFSDINMLKPVAMIIDVSFCLKKQIACEKLLKRINMTIPSVPVFLTHSRLIDSVQLMAKGLVYAKSIQGLDCAGLCHSLKSFKADKKPRIAMEYYRTPVRLACMVKKLGASGVFEGSIRDLSPRGMKVVLDDPLNDWKSGDEVRFSLGQTSDAQKMLEGFANLRWTRELNGQAGPRGSEIGLEFATLPPEILKTFISTLNDFRVGQLNGQLN